MRIIPFLAALGFLAVAAPASRAQMPIPAPNGWNAQTRAGGATAFVPSDLARGEVYSTTVYDSAALGGKTLGEYLSAFAGTVSKAPGHLASPLKVQTNEGRVVSGSGIYNGPNGTALGAMFIGVSLDGGANIHMMRTLFSGESVLGRYGEGQKSLMSAMVARAKAEAGDNLHTTPPQVLRHLTPGG